MRVNVTNQRSRNQLGESSFADTRSTLDEPQANGGIGVTNGEEPNLTTPAVEFRNVSFAYEDKNVLKNLSFKLTKGEIKIILSGSGGGKSTILNLILGLLKPDSGEILINGKDISPLDETELQPVRDQMGMVFQEGALFDSLSVYENVAYRLRERGMPDEDVEEEVRSLLNFVQLEDELGKLPNALSGGMRKRLSIGRALVGNPKIVLFDEPTVALDPITTGSICDLIIQLRDLEGVASIIVTHEMDVVKCLTSEYLSVTDRGELRFKEEGEDLCLTNTNILMLRDGREIFSGTGRELVEENDPYIHEFIRGTELVTERKPGNELHDGRKK